nr:hypothetical protein HK105_007000 [Polyrhizophydium stewartii]
MWPKFLLQTMGMIVSPKFASKLVWVDNLARLQTLVPTEKLVVPPAVLRYNQQQEAPSSFLSFSRKTTTKKATVFEEDLDVLMGVDGSKGCPQVILDCAQFIRTQGLETEGLFRKAPAVTAVQEAKRAYNEGKQPDFDALGGVHVACALLKLWFRELPEPLIPASLYPTVREVEKSPSKVDFIRMRLLPSLSIPTQLVMYELFSLLHDVVAHQATNLMTAVNLTIVWSPNFVKSDNAVLDIGMCAIGVQGAGIGTIVKTCVEEFDAIFGESIGTLRRSNSLATSVASTHDGEGEVDGEGANVPQAASPVASPVASPAASPTRADSAQ